MHIFDVVEIIKSAGLIGIFAIVFAESGLFFGFFFPGDSLLFTAGFLASQGYLPIWLLSFGTFVSAVLGDSVGYAFGRRVGPKLFYKEDSFFFKKAYLEKTKHFYDRYGKKTIVLCRFVPIVRTFAPIFAGIGEMTYKTFISYNIIGGFIWSFGVTFIGYFLGKTIPNADKYLLPIIIVIIVASFVPVALEYFRSRKK